MRCTYTGLSNSTDFKSTNKCNSHCIYINKNNRFFLVFSIDQEVWICNICGGQYASELDVKTYEHGNPAKDVIKFIMSVVHGTSALLMTVMNLYARTVLTKFKFFLG